MGCSSSSTQTVAQENRPGTKPEEANRDTGFVASNGMVAEDAETIADQMQLPIQCALLEELGPGQENREPAACEALQIAELEVAVESKLTPESDLIQSRAPEEVEAEVVIADDAAFVSTAIEEESPVEATAQVESVGANSACLVEVHPSDVPVASAVPLEAASKAPGAAQVPEVLPIRDQTTTEPTIALISPEPTPDVQLSLAPQPAPVPETTPATEPAPAESGPAPEPEPVVEAKPFPEPTPVLEPAPAPEPTQFAEPSPESEPLFKARPFSEPTPVLEPAPAPKPTQFAEIAPEPEPVVEAKPFSEQIPIAGPAPAAELALARELTLPLESTIVSEPSSNETALPPKGDLSAVEEPATRAVQQHPEHDAQATSGPELHQVVQLAAAPAAEAVLQATQEHTSVAVTSAEAKPSEQFAMQASKDPEGPVWEGAVSKAQNDVAKIVTLAEADMPATAENDGELDFDVAESERPLDRDIP